MTSTGQAPAPAREKPPSYFAKVSANAAKLWAKLDDDPVLAGPWRQLFSQVQSPRHVLSELLQNADDSGATKASACIQDGTFCFRHNGDDFTNEQFESLCRFGFSNKRNLHTIGFRGIGFKSTFSLGANVHVFTPSLAVRFNRRHFTKPQWIPGAESSADTQVRVPLQDEHREAELRKNLDEWISSPTSLLFFSNIRILEIDGSVIERKSLGEGPVPRSEWVGLSTVTGQRLLVVRSEHEKFPDDATEEIRKERLSGEIELPPCQVELVLGLPFSQRLFVVLPTGVKPNVPFSCNAPFVQDPARLGIREPSISPTNRWLLERLGRLAAETMTRWLENSSVPVDARARAYDLLPERAEARDDLDSAATDFIRTAFEKTIDDSRVLLADTGDVLPSSGCFAPPRPLYRVWSSEQLIKSFGGDYRRVLSQAVTDSQRTRLSQWDWLRQTGPQSILQTLSRGTRPDRPDSWASLAELWGFVERHAGYDYSGNPRRRLAIVPVLNDSRLEAADATVRVSDTRRGLRPDDWHFIIEGLSQLHPDWVAELKTHESDDTEFAKLSGMLGEIGLGDTTPIDRVVQHRAEAFFRPDGPSLEECVRFAHILAALDATVPECFEYVARNNARRRPGYGLFLDDGSLAEIVPDDWADERFLHEDYESRFTHCSRDQWRSWSRSSKSRLSNCSFFVKSVQTPWSWSKRSAKEFLASRGVDGPIEYHYKAPSFRLTDYDFEERLRAHWAQLAAEDPTVWGRVVERILISPLHERSGVLHADLRECWGDYARLVRCDKIPAKWLVALRSQPCLPDTHHRLREPAHLLVRSPDTEPLLGAEDFVAAELDTPGNREILIHLGTRSTPAGANSILDRIRALSEAEKPPLTELGRWYDAVDRVLARRRPEDLQVIRKSFKERALVFTEQGEWARLGEVFQRLHEDDPPGLPTIHPEFAHLALWSVLGVAERPSPDLLVDYVGALGSGQRLDGGQLRRVRAVLREQPARVWNECGHWLALDGSWQRIEQLERVLFEDSAVRVRELFPQIKSSTADCRSIRPEARAHECFGRLTDLAAALDYRPVQTRAVLPQPGRREWLVELGSYLARIRLDEGPQRQRIRKAGVRLSNTLWQPFAALKVVPHLTGSPAGLPYEPVVLWDGETLYVREQSTARVCDAVVAELSRAFSSDAIQRAIRSCYERDVSFIADYLAAHFSFDDEEALTNDNRAGPSSTRPETSDDSMGLGVEPPTVLSDSQPQDSKSDEGGSGPPETSEDIHAGHDDGTSGEDVPEGGVALTQSAHKPPRPRGEPLIVRFARSMGFKPGNSKYEWFHYDGSCLEHTGDIFPWVHRKDDRVIQRYWLAEQSLHQSGVDLGADVWEMLRKQPELCSFILAEGGLPVVWPGRTLMQMVQTESLGLFTARYRLRKLNP